MAKDDLDLDKLRAARGRLAKRRAELIGQMAKPKMPAGAPRSFLDVQAAIDKLDNLEQRQKGTPVGIGTKVIEG